MVCLSTGPQGVWLLVSGYWYDIRQQGIEVWDRKEGRKGKKWDPVTETAKCTFPYGRTRLTYVLSLRML